MNREDRLRFIDEELTGLWPDWEPTDAELRLWMGVLTDPPYALARRALQRCFCGPAGQYRRPRPAVFIEAVRALCASAPAGPKVARDPEPCVIFECVEPPKDNPGRPHRRIRAILPSSGEPLRAAAVEQTAKRCAEVYGGRWVMVSVPPAAEGASPRACEQAGASV